MAISGNLVNNIIRTLKLAAYEKNYFDLSTYLENKEHQETWRKTGLHFDETKAGLTNFLTIQMKQLNDVDIVPNKEEFLTLLGFDDDDFNDNATLAQMNRHFNKLIKPREINLIADALSAKIHAKHPEANLDEFNVNLLKFKDQLTKKVISLESITEALISTFGNDISIEGENIPTASLVREDYLNIQPPEGEGGQSKPLTNLADQLNYMKKAEADEIVQAVQNANTAHQFEPKKLQELSRQLQAHPANEQGIKTAFKRAQLPVSLKNLERIQQVTNDELNRLRKKGLVTGFVDFFQGRGSDEKEEQKERPTPKKFPQPLDKPEGQSKKPLSRGNPLNPDLIARFQKEQAQKRKEDIIPGKISDEAKARLEAMLKRKQMQGPLKEPPLTDPSSKASKQSISGRINAEFDWKRFKEELPKLVDDKSDYKGVVKECTMTTIDGEKVEDINTMTPKEDVDDVKTFDLKLPGDKSKVTIHLQEDSAKNIKKYDYFIEPLDDKTLDDAFKVIDASTTKPSSNELRKIILYKKDWENTQKTPTNIDGTNIDLTARERIWIVALKNNCIAHENPQEEKDFLDIKDEARYNTLNKIADKYRTFEAQQPTVKQDIEQAASSAPARLMGLGLVQNEE